MDVDAEPLAEPLEAKVTRAVAGDGAALDQVVRAIKDDVYGLAIRMLWHPADAEDATQEILIRVVTQLSTFEGRSRFRTWVYRVATRALLNFRRGRAEHGLSFEEYGEDLRDGLEPGAPASLMPEERAILKREVKIACTQAMLLCLDRDHRIAYVLGEILELPGDEAAECLEISPATFRKRLSRARGRVETFTAAACGLVSQSAACSCAGRIGPAIALGRIDPNRLLFAKHAVREVSVANVEAVVHTLEKLPDAATLMRSNPAYAAPEQVIAPAIATPR